nr:MAG TPA: hypothetical protein [Caudoviricetes sp.]
MRKMMSEGLGLRRGSWEGPVEGVMAGSLSVKGA